ncbi:MAG: putative nucleotidyltransferase substrate binding domain-containing protein [Thermomicrobium sp.]|nr:putative nucleotidyltransferase substrate binding domain-containing protein [Thermomicrobium sp.]
MDDVVLGSVVEFLRRVPPFQFLDEERLERLTKRVEVHYFPRGAVLIRRGERPPEYLWVVVRGGVKKVLRTATGEEHLFEVASEGDLVGVLSSVDGLEGQLDDIAVEDTVCYAIPRTVVEELIASEPAVARFFLGALREWVRASLTALERQEEPTDGALVLSAPCRTVVRYPLLTCPLGTTVRRAAQVMSAERVNSIVVVDANGRGVGIVTDWDLRERVIAAGRSPEVPVEEIMSAPLVTIDADRLLLEAVRVMIARGINHLVVTEEGKPYGMLTAFDLLVRQGTSALFLARALERETRVERLAEILEQAQRQLLPFLLSRGVRASEIAQIVSEINDRVIARVLALLEQELGPPPVPYCWLVFGSEGRREQTIRTDQDNGILYADPPAGAEQAVRGYFLRLGQWAVERLVALGFPPCPGRYSADNPEWVLTESEWRRKFRAWMSVPEPQAVLNSLIVFDFRGVHGELALATELRDFVRRELAHSPRFLFHVAAVSTAQPPPLGFLGRFVVERSGEHRNQLDLKLGGTGAIVNLVRLFALEHGIEETNTLARLLALRESRAIEPALAEDLARAFEFLLELRLRVQLEQLQRGERPSNHVDPRQLSSLDRTLLKEAFRVVARAQAVVRDRFHLEQAGE